MTFSQKDHRPVLLFHKGNDFLLGKDRNRFHFFQASLVPKILPYIKVSFLGIKDGDKEYSCHRQVIADGFQSVDGTQRNL